MIFIILWEIFNFPGEILLLVSDSFSLRAGPASRVLTVCLGLKLTSPLSRAPAPPTLRREAAPLSLYTMWDNTAEVSAGTVFDTVSQVNKQSQIFLVLSK